jgi:hypothetical protein
LIAKYISSEPANIHSIGVRPGTIEVSIEPTPPKIIIAPRNILIEPFIIYPQVLILYK